MGSAWGLVEYILNILLVRDGSVGSILCGICWYTQCDLVSGDTVQPVLYFDDGDVDGI